MTLCMFRVCLPRINKANGLRGLAKSQGFSYGARSASVAALEIFACFLDILLTHLGIVHKKL